MRKKVNRDVDTVTASWKGKNENTEKKKKKKKNVVNRRGFKSPDAIHNDFNSESKRNMEKKKKQEKRRRKKKKRK